jgi:uncharacterized membrane protein YgdD (TMEM256/DUF423 family)
MTMIDRFGRTIVALAGLLGAAGVAAAASASHAGDERILGSLALVALTQAPALVALGLWAKGRLMRAAAAVIGAGALLFVIDLGVRHFTGSGLVALAPIGGVAMIAGWLLLAAGAVFAGDR